jgi:hypothetical protein
MKKLIKKGRKLVGLGGQEMRKKLKKKEKEGQEGALTVVRRMKKRKTKTRRRKPNNEDPIEDPYAISIFITFIIIIL